MLQDPEDEICIRKILYDAVLLGESLFQKSDTFTRLPLNQLKNLCLAWLLVADDAIQFTRYTVTIAAHTQILVLFCAQKYDFPAFFLNRENGEHASSVAYMETFSKCELIFSKCELIKQLLKWVICPTATEEKPDTRTPRAIISKSPFVFSHYIY